MQSDTSASTALTMKKAGAGQIRSGSKLETGTHDSIASAVAFDFEGLLDEVRISDAALTRDALLTRRDREHQPQAKTKSGAEPTILPSIDYAYW